MLAEKLKKSEHYVVSHDESINEVTRNCQMDVLIRYIDEDGKQVKLRYLDSLFFGNFTNADLFK